MDIPKELTKSERLELHNLMLLVSVEEEKLKRYELASTHSKNTIYELKCLIQKWVDDYTDKLDIEKGKKLFIDPETGTIEVVAEGNSNDNISGCRGTGC